MPRQKVMNGHGAAEPDPHYELTLQLLNDLRQFWLGQLKNAPADDVTFTRLSVVALTQFSAMLAVDVGMSDDQFAKVCKAQFKASYDRAPKFG